MKRIIALFASIILVVSAVSAQQISFLVSDGVADSVLKSSIERNLSRFLSAFRQGVQPDWTGVEITEGAKMSVQLLWENTPFHCEESRIVERVLHIAGGDGYKVRNIPIEMETGAEDSYQELVVGLDEKGCIIGVNLAISNHLYHKLMSGGADVSDLRQRQMILDYVEQFRTAYNRKDMHFLEQVFSDDALIITGQVIQRKKGDRAVSLSKEIVYREQSKKEYLERLRTRVFPNTKYIRVNFSDIEVSKHPSIKGYYGVKLRQGYESSNYSDEGYLFMIWDFRDESHPQIHVRTWQPYWLDEFKEERLPEKEVFTINDFTVE